MLGWLMFLVGWIWLMVVAFKSNGALWGVLIFFFSILAGLIFCITKKEGWMQWGIMLIGFLVMMFSGGMAMMGAMSAVS